MICRPLIAMNCYFDGSVGDKLEKWLTLGGLAAPNSTWDFIQQRWAEMLGNREPIAPYVHMTDLITGNQGVSVIQRQNGDMLSEPAWRPAGSMDIDRMFHTRF